MTLSIRDLPNIHLGEVLREAFLAPLGLISPDTAARLARYFRTSAAFWPNLQAEHDLAAVEAAKGVELDAITPRPDIPV